MNCKQARDEADTSDELVVRVGASWCPFGLIRLQVGSYYA